MSRSPNFFLCLVLSALSFLRLSALAQFTGVALPPPSPAPTAGFSIALGDALEISFNQADAPNSSFGPLDQGFGSYLAPRPRVLTGSRIYFNSEPTNDDAPDAAAVKRGQFFTPPIPSALAFSPPEPSRGQPAVLHIRW